MYRFLIFLVIHFYILSCKEKEFEISKKRDMTDNKIKEFFITCDKKDFISIYKNYSSDNYIPIKITYNGITNSDAIMRIRGDSSRKFPKKSLKIRLNSEPAILNRYVLNINAEYEDPSYIHQYLASRIMNESGHATFTSEHVRIYLNGEFLGLYLLIENVDEAFLKNRGLDPDGNLYKASKDGACLSFYDDVNKHWEKKTNENSGRDDLILLINQLDTIRSNYFEYAKHTFNYENMVNIIAMNCLITNSSTYYHNYYMYNTKTIHQKKPK